MAALAGTIHAKPLMRESRRELLAAHIAFAVATMLLTLLATVGAR